MSAEPSPTSVKSPSVFTTKVETTYTPKSAGESFLERMMPQKKFNAIITICLTNMADAPLQVFSLISLAVSPPPSPRLKDIASPKRFALIAFGYPLHHSLYSFSGAYFREPVKQTLRFCHICHKDHLVTQPRR